MKIYTKKALQEAYRQKQKLKYIFFWGHTPSQKGVIDKAIFSQWYSAKFTVEGIVYPTAEHFMMAEKARLFSQKELAEEIIATPSPAQAKALGRKVLRFDEEVWKKHRFEIVCRGNFAKFSQNSDLGEYLLQTGKKILVEASPVDAIWGIGMAYDHPDAENPLLWRGLNLLGFALMKVRDDLDNQPF